MAEETYEPEAAYADVDKVVEARELAPSVARPPASQFDADIARLSGKIDELLMSAPSRGRRVPSPITGLVFGLDVEQSETRVSHSLTGSRTRKPRVTPELDPQLQVAVARVRSGMPSYAVTSASEDEIPVIARVTDVSAWEDMSEVRVGATIGQTEDGDWIVTARIPVRRVEAVQKHPTVVSLQASQPLRPLLAATLAETGASPDALPQETGPEGGRGVVIGIVDFGCDFAHRNFRTENGASRIESLWDQASAQPTNSSFGYGRVHRRADIDAALMTPDPYRTLQYQLDRDTPERKGTHGTHVADIAAGNGFGSGVAGCAPDATIVFVDLSASDIAWDGPRTVDVSFGDSARLLEAVRFVFDQAGDRPCVVNLSLGTHGGPHDGTTAVERGLDALLRAKPNRAVVIAASNSYSDGIHASVTVPASGAVDLLWEHPVEDQPAELDIWFPRLSQTAVELMAQDGTTLGIVEPGENREIVFERSIAIFVANRLDVPGNHDNHIGIYLAGVFPAGAWTVRLHSRSNAAASGHAWVERNDFGQSSFAPPHDNTHTLGSISCGRETIVVGSYDAHKASSPISYFSSSGPTRDGREKPEISAPGHTVLAAWSRTGSSVTRKSGTSMAAPAVSGIVALLLAEARRQNRDLSIHEIRQLVIDCARKDPPGSALAWDPRYGYGRIHAPSLLSALIPALEDVG